MKLTRKQVNEYIRNILIFVKEPAIVGKIELPDTSATIVMDIQPSNGGNAHTISYIPATRIGVPVEIKINADQHYGKIVLKFDGTIPGYEVFAKDPFGNNIHMKQFPNATFTTIRGELERLVADTPPTN